MAAGRRERDRERHTHLERKMTLPDSDEYSSDDDVPLHLFVPRSVSRGLWIRLRQEIHVKLVRYFVKQRIELLLKTSSDLLFYLNYPTSDFSHKSPRSPPQRAEEQTIEATRRTHSN